MLPVKCTRDTNVIISVMLTMKPSSNLFSQFSYGIYPLSILPDYSEYNWQWSHRIVHYG